MGVPLTIRDTFEYVARTINKIYAVAMLCRQLLKLWDSLPGKSYVVTTPASIVPQ